MHMFAVALVTFVILLILRFLDGKLIEWRSQRVIASLEAGTPPEESAPSDDLQQYHVLSEVVYSQIWKTLHALGHQLDASGDIRVEKISKYIKNGDEILRFFIDLEERLEVYRANIDLRGAMEEVRWSLATIPEVVNIEFMQGAVTKALMKDC